MEWIKCSDRLPKTEGDRCVEGDFHECYGDCLVVLHRPDEAPYCSGDYFFTRCPEWNEKGQYVGFSDFKWCYYDDLDDIEVGINHEFVTHWMPYPEPPKESGDE